MLKPQKTDHYYEPAKWHDLRDFSHLRDVDYFLKQAALYGPRILECAVGTGRIALALAQAGYDVWGVDRDPAMLARAEEKWGALRDGSPGKLTTTLADMTDFHLRRRFDLVFIAFNTFLTLAESEHRESFLRRVRDRLKPNGRFIIDLSQPDCSLMAMGHPERLDYIVEDPDSGRLVRRYSWLRCDMARQRSEVSFEYRWNAPDGEQHTATTSFPICIVFPEEMRLLLRLTGFEVEEIHGDHDGSPFTRDSPRMIFVARKRSLR